MTTISKPRQKSLDDEHDERRAAVADSIVGDAQISKAVGPHHRPVEGRRSAIGSRGGRRFEQREMLDQLGVGLREGGAH